MDLQGQRDLLLLSEVERNSTVTQRSLATKLGVALGLTNLYLKRLARKGYIKVTTIPKHRIQYLLTPSGLAEKSRLTYLYMEYSLSYYRNMRQRLKDVFSGLPDGDTRRIVIYGTGELAELAYLSLLEMNLTFVGFIDGKARQRFLSYPVWPLESLSDWKFDAVLVADLEQADQIRQCLAGNGVSKEKIITLAS